MFERIVNTPQLFLFDMSNRYYFYYWIGWVFGQIQVSLYFISSQCSLSLPPESIRKPQVFWCFQGVLLGNIGLETINLLGLYLTLLLGCWSCSVSMGKSEYGKKGSLFGSVKFLVVLVNHSVHWGINLPSKTQPPSFFAKPPPRKSAKCPSPPSLSPSLPLPILGNSPPYICFSWPPALKIAFFSESP